MANKVTAIRVTPVPGGSQFQGLAKTDRGTKYILDSFVVIHERQDLKAAVETVTESIGRMLGESRDI